MTILFNACEKIQPTSNRRFGAGLFAYAPHFHVSHTAQDEIEYTQMLADREQAVRDFNQHLEERCQRSAQLDRVCSGPMF